VLIEDGHRDGGVNGAEVDFIVEESGALLPIRA
jgi:hypothetical protein